MGDQNKGGAMGQQPMKPPQGGMGGVPGGLPNMGVQAPNFKTPNGPMGMPPMRPPGGAGGVPGGMPNMGVQQPNFKTPNGPMGMPGGAGGPGNTYQNITGLPPGGGPMFQGGQNVNQPGGSLGGLLSQAGGQQQGSPFGQLRPLTGPAGGAGGKG